MLTDKQLAVRATGLGGSEALTRTPHGDGYLTINDVTRGMHRLEHLVIAEKALGKPLPVGVEVHHVNHVRSDNRNENLVICPNSSYHALLHRRERAFDACGHAHWRLCAFCGKWDAPENLYIPKRGTVEHRRCGNEYRKAWQKANKPWRKK